LSDVRVGIIKRRARMFLDLAPELMGRDVSDIAAFHTDQACWLRVKASILKLTRSVPRGLECYGYW